MRVLNLHGYSEFDARNAIVDAIYDCQDSGETALKVIHGFNNGTKIKNLINKMKNETDEIVSVVSLGNSGESIIYLRYFE